MQRMKINKKYLNTANEVIHASIAGSDKAVAKKENS